jgi:VanZ family protein
MISCAIHRGSSRLVRTSTPRHPPPAPVARTRLRVRLWLLTVAFIVYGTTIPFQFVDNLDLVSERLSRVSLNPLISPETGRRVSIPDVVQNVLLFVPFGVLAMSSMGRRFPIARLALVTLAAALLSTAVEVLQLFTVDRTTSLSDVVANSMGGLLGALAWPVVVSTARGASRYARHRRWTDARAFYPFVVTIGLLCVAAWEPFDPSLELGTVWSKLKRFSVDPLQASGFSGDEPLQLLRFGAATVAGAFAYLERRLSAPAMRAAALCVAIGVVLEASQIAIESRMPSVEDALLCIAGAICGAAAFPALRKIRSADLWLTCVAAATVVGAVGVYLTPFTFGGTYHAVQWFPFLAYYEYTSTEVVSHVFQLVLLYMPVGFVGAAVSTPTLRSSLVVSFFVVLATAIGLEYCQGWIDGRYPDVTDVGISLVGWSVGVWLGGTGWARFSHRTGDGGAQD